MNPNIAKIIENINKGIIPEGYKKTKVGIVPVEWEMIKLNNISRHITEKNKDMKYNETYTNSATQGIIKQTDYFDKQISNADNIDGYYIVRQNDYVYNPRISVSAPCGPISKSHFSETGIMSPLYTVFRLNDEYGNNDYIEHYFKSSFWYRYMSSVANYGVRHDRMNITNEDLFNMPIPFPPLPEQQKIAEILSTQDKLIELYERKIEQLKTLKKGYLQKMFPKKGCKYPELRFKGFTDDWEQRKLNSLTLVITKGTTPLDKSNSGTVNFIKVENIDDSSGEISISQKISAEEHKGYLKRSQLKENDILFSIAGTLGRVTSVHSSILPANTNQALAIIRLREGNLNFIKTFLKSQAIANYIKRNPTVGAQPNLSLEQVSNLEIQLPNIQEQQFIGDYFKSIDNLITLHQHKLDKEKQKKKALMQLLLTGKVRVST